MPAARTKAGREHRIPLSSRAVEILDDARRLGVASTGVMPSGLVFPSQRGKAIGDARLSGVLQQLGIGACRTDSGPASGTGPRNGQTTRGR